MFFADDGTYDGNTMVCGFPRWTPNGPMGSLSGPSQRETHVFPEKFEKAKQIRNCLRFALLAEALCGFDTGRL